jgi:hypothetical protein
MKIDDFLDRHVEGYLFKDLDAMSAISLKPGEAYGAVGYPMVSTALAGIELLGGLVSPQVFNANNGAIYFRNFWEGPLYGRDSNRKPLSNAIYKLARHGLAHVFVAKPRICVQKLANNPNHLHRDPAGDLIIDSIVLAQDLKAAYLRDVKPQLGTPLGKTMQARLGEMIARYSAQSKELDTIISGVPTVFLITDDQVVTSSSSPSVSGGTFISAVNSPAVPGTAPKN